MIISSADRTPKRIIRRRSGLAFWPRLLVGASLALLGLLVGAGGAWLISLGGSWYYLPAGIALLASGSLLLSGGQTTAMTYGIGGQQYFVIVPAGNRFMETKVGH